MGGPQDSIFMGRQNLKSIKLYGFMSLFSRNHLSKSAYVSTQSAAKETKVTEESCCKENAASVHIMWCV